MNRTWNAKETDLGRRETRRVDPLGLLAAGGFLTVCVFYWADIYGLCLAAGTVAGVLMEPTRLAGVALWAVGWIWGLV